MERRYNNAKPSISLTNFEVGSIFWYVVVGMFLISIVVVSAITLWYVTDTNSSVNNIVPAASPIILGSCAAGEERRKDAYLLRANVAYQQYIRPVPCHVNNQDETTHTNYIGQFTKGMTHDSNGIVSAADYISLLYAVQTGAPSDFYNIKRYFNASRKYVNPQAGLAFDLVGADSHSVTMGAAPTFSSALQAGEFVEVAWMALARDVPFDQYGLEPITIAAIDELNSLTEFRGIKPVTAANLFRSSYSGAVTGPYLSQFFYQTVYLGANHVNMKIDPPIPSVNFMTQYDEFLRIQNGENPSGTITLTGMERYMINGRDISHYVHIDEIAQAYHVAGMWLMQENAPWNPTNPYLNYLNQEPFSTYGKPMVYTLVNEVAMRALHAVWYQKWFVHRRLRPEAFGGFVHQTKVGAYSFPIHNDALNSVAIQQINATFGTYLLPQAFPEGSPMHPSYGAGHATVSAACVTVLKALFDGAWVIPNPVMPSANGSATVPYVGDDLTVEHELNKLSGNIALARNMAGVHYRTDYDNAVPMGEKIAMEMLRDYKGTFNEGPALWSFKNFEGDTVYV